MGIRLRNTSFYDQDGTAYSLEVHQEGHNGASLSVPLRSIRLRYQGDDSNIHHPVLASSLDFSISVKDQEVEDALKQMYGAAEGVWRVVLRKETALHWIGMIVTDQVQFADSVFPYDFSISAVDGLARLRDIEYTGEGATWDGWQTILVHLKNVLSLVPTVDLWGSEAYIKTHSTIFANNFNGEAYTATPFTGHRVQHIALRSVDGQGNTNYATGYQALLEFGYMFGARIFQANGCWNVEQITSYARTDADIVIFPYSSSLGALSTETLSNWGSRRITVDRSDVRLSASADATMESGGVHRFLAPLLEAKVQYRHYSTRSIIGIGRTWVTLNHPEVEVESVDSDPAKLLIQAQYSFRVEFDNNTTPFPLIRGWYKFRVKIRIDSSHWLKRTANFVNGIVTYDEPTWETSEAFYEFFSFSLDLIDNTNSTQYLNFLTPAVPASGTLYIDFDFVDLLTISGPLADSGATAHTVEWSVTRPYIEVFFDGTIDSRYRYSVYTSVNSADTNSEKIEISTLFGSGIQSNTYGRIQANSSAGWVNSVLWSNYPETGMYWHGGLIARQILTPRSNPAKLMEGRLRGDVGANNIIDRNGERFIFLGGTIDIADASTEGTWVYITDVATSVSDPGEPVDGLEPFVTPFEDEFGPGGDEIDPLIVILPGDGLDAIADSVALPTAIVTDHATDTTDAPVVSGTEITALAITEQGVTIPWQDGDELMIVDPYTGIQQVVVVNDDEAENTIAIEAVTPTHDFPQNSLVVPTNEFMWRLLNRLRRIPIRIQVIAPKFEIAYTITELDQFWRVPITWSGYKLTSIEAGVFATGTATISVTTSVQTDVYTTTVTGGQSRGLTTLTTYRVLTEGDLVKFGISSVGAGTYPKGLVITLIAIALV